MNSFARDWIRDLQRKLPGDLDALQRRIILYSSKHATSDAIMLQAQCEEMSKNLAVIKTLQEVVNAEDRESNTPGR
jgi:hypothetical protein